MYDIACLSTKAAVILKTFYIGPNLFQSFNFDGFVTRFQRICETIKWQNNRSMNFYCKNANKTPKIWK